MNEKKKDQGIYFFTFGDVLKKMVVMEDCSSSSPKQITNFINCSDLEVDLEEASSKYGEAETCDHVFGCVAFKRHLCQCQHGSLPRMHLPCISDDVW